MTLYVRIGGTEVNQAVNRIEYFLESVHLFVDFFHLGQHLQYDKVALDHVYFTVRLDLFDSIHYFAELRTQGRNCGHFEFHEIKTAFYVKWLGLRIASDEP